MLNKIRVVIVEDSELARNELKYLLSLHPDVEVVGAFEDTASAWPVIATGEIDGVFLDIHIQTESERAGLDLAIKISNLPSQKPWIVFTSIHDEHALEGYDVDALRFLIPPLTNKEVTRVLDKIRKEYPRNTINPVPSRIEIRHKTIDRDEVIWCTKYVLEDDIRCIESNNNSNTTKVELVSGEILDGINKPLWKWLEEKELPNFQQIYKSCLVNLNHVDGIRPDPFKEDYCHVVTFRGSKHTLPISKKRLDDLRKTLRNKGLEDDNDVNKKASPINKN